MRWWDDLKIGKKLCVGLGFVILLGLGGFFTASQALQNYVKAVGTTGALCQQAVVTAQEASLASNTMARETMAYVYTAEQQHWDAKMKADDEAGQSFDKLKALLQKLPDNKALLASLEAASTQDDKQCNPLENQTMELAKTGKRDKAKQLFSERYIPVRAQLESLLNKFIVETKAYAQNVADKNAASAAAAVKFGWGCQFFIITFSISLLIFLVKGITQPIRQISERLETLQDVCLTSLGNAVESLAKGDLTVAVETGIEPIKIDRKDEFGEMAQTFNAMLARTKGTVESFGHAQVSLQNLIGEVAASTRLLAATSANLSTSASQTGQAATEISRTIQEVASAAAQSAMTSQEMAKASEQQARSATEAAGAMERLQAAVTQVQAGGEQQERQARQADSGMQQAAQAVEQVAVSASQMASTAQQAAKVAETGGKAVEATIFSMSRIQEQVSASSEKVRELGEQGKAIGAIVDTIDQIAEQTNLLALNAAIEAARAGEHGRGFAVVADEVRKLAERATQATKEIGSLIGGVRAGVQHAVQAMESTREEVQQGAARSEEAGNALLQILEAAQSVASEVQAVTATAQQMSASVQSVRVSVTGVRQVSEETDRLVNGMAAGAHQVAAAITTVASISEETAAGAEEMSAVAEEVSASAENVSAAAAQQTASIDEVNAAARDLSGMAERLQELVNQFKLEETVAVKTTPIVVAPPVRKAA